MLRQSLGGHSGVLALMGTTGVDRVNTARPTPLRLSRKSRWIRPGRNNVGSQRPIR
jgi:hypothetical protein